MRKILTALLGAAVGMALGLAITRPQTIMVEARAQAAASDPRQLDRFIAAFDRIHAGYVDQLDQSDLIDAAIKGMVGALDSQSSYLDWKLFRDIQITHYFGPASLGMETIPEKGRVKVIAPIDETPAARAGLRAKDVITHIDGVPVERLTPHELVIDKTRGQVNTTVRLTIVREGEDKPLELTLAREMMRLHAVRSRVDGGDIGYIRIRLLSDGTVQALGKAISELSSQISADRLKGYVLDLRNTPGGLLDAAVSTADAFLEEGEIVSVRGRTAEQIERFNARPGDISDGKPLVILINAGTASGAEIVAGALQDHKRATVMGTRSFGRGSVQTIVPLGDRSGALRVTTARYFTPAGRSFDGTGILPDIEVPQDIPGNQENDKALTLAFELLRGTTAPHQTR